jgi:hypothetical protein
MAPSEEDKKLVREEDAMCCLRGMNTQDFHDQKLKDKEILEM